MSTGPDTDAGSDVRIVRLGGQEFRVRTRVPLASLMRFAHTSKATGLNELDEWDAIYRLCQAALDPDEDFDRFLDAAEQSDADEKTLMLFVRKVITGQTERPTQRPSDSSDGPASTEPSSEPVSSSPVDEPKAWAEIKTRLEQQGRPDMAEAVLMANSAN